MNWTTVYGFRAREIPRDAILMAWRVASHETSAVASLPRNVRAYVLPTPNFEKLHERHRQFLRKWSPFPPRVSQRWEYGEKVSTKQTRAFLIEGHPEWFKIIIRLENPNIARSLIHELKHIANADEDFSRMLDYYSQHRNRKRAKKSKV